ncbi:hypothetical protein KL907_002984 [Ogataea polymorpha]|nr:hypothetical protein KL907_002984 [Ogataea polymorpha]
MFPIRQFRYLVPAKFLAQLFKPSGQCIENSTDDIYFSTQQASIAHAMLYCLRLQTGPKKEWTLNLGLPGNRPLVILQPDLPPYLKLCQEGNVWADLNPACYQLISKWFDNPVDLSSGWLCGAQRRTTTSGQD